MRCMCKYCLIQKCFLFQLMVLQNMFCNQVFFYYRYFNLVLTILVHQDHIKLNISQNSCSWNLCNTLQFPKLPGLPREQLMTPWIPGIASMCNGQLIKVIWNSNILDWNPRQKETNFTTCIATISARSLAAALSRSEALWGEVGERGHLRNHIFSCVCRFFSKQEFWSLNFLGFGQCWEWKHSGKTDPSTETL